LTCPKQPGSPGQAATGHHSAATARPPAAATPRAASIAYLADIPSGIAGSFPGYRFDAGGIESTHGELINDRSARCTRSVGGHGRARRGGDRTTHLIEGLLEAARSDASLWPQGSLRRYLAWLEELTSTRGTQDNVLARAADLELALTETLAAALA
jgi:hypothetical protein